MSCCVPFCDSNYSKHRNLSFHEFPSDIDMQFAWLRAISRKDFCPNDKSNSSRVCSKHFRVEDYMKNLKVRRLKPNAVPSVFPGYPSYLLENPIIPKPGLNESKESQHIVSPSTEDSLLLLNFSHTLENALDKSDKQNVEQLNNKSCQTELEMSLIANLYKENSRLKQLLSSKNKVITGLIEKIATVKEEESPKRRKKS